MKKNKSFDVININCNKEINCNEELNCNKELNYNTELNFNKEINSHEQLNKFGKNDYMNNQKETKIQESTNIIHLIKKSNEPKNNANTIYFFLSELGLIFIVGIIIVILFFIPQYHSAKTFTSKSVDIFNSNYIPKIFIHTTDIHISAKKHHLVDGSTIFLTSLYEYKPDSFIMTGDIVDNFIGKLNTVGGQNTEDWKIYNISIRKQIAKFPVIDVSGNHDLWGIKSANSENNYFLDHGFMFNRSNVLEEKDFFIKKVKRFNITFLLLNDYRFPIIRPPYGAETNINKKQLDILENEIDNLNEEECYILSHYPVDRSLIVKSSKGNDFEHIVSNKKIGFIFTGHQHPNKVNIIHHGSEGGLEFCTSSAFDKKRAGLITIDNDNLIYHEVFIPYYGSKPLFFLTYPVPNEQISSHHIFNLNNFEIRVLSYADDKNIKLKIEGDIIGELNYVTTLKNGAFLYSYPVFLSDGSYKIHIYDENGYSCDINTEFTVGNTYKGKKEKYIYFPRFLIILRFMLIPFWLFLLIILFPVWPDSNLKIVKDIEKKIKGDKKYDINTGLLILYLIILGPFFLRLRFQEEKKILKISFFIAFLYPLVLPIHFMESFDGIISYTFLVFIVNKEKIFYEHWALGMTFLYYIGVVYSHTIFLSGKKYYNKNNIVIIVLNSLFCVTLYALDFVINFNPVNQSISLGYLFFTPGFIIIWIILLIISIKYY